jgi:hypothetical protein
VGLVLLLNYVVMDVVLKTKIKKEQANGVVKLEYVVEFPCKVYSKKLSESHKGDKRYQYRRELPSNLKRIKKIGIQKWLKEQKTRWQCPKCLGTIKFYHYQCSDCGLKKQI